ncbi:hypothetical protein ACQF36_32985 [Streptomyces sp. Marseille-Q5077]|uniref:hypothetical protein n=1 Tax=Streptomyces sp. Marseille-Q5077 TaxID=3418995 RepID=UPI003CFC37C3
MPLGGGAIWELLSRERRGIPLHADLDDVDEPAPSPPARYSWRGRGRRRGS